MMHVSNLIDLSDIKQNKEQEDQDPRTKETASVINWLFTELRGNFPAFKQAWPDSDHQRQAKKIWLKAFMLAGITKVEQLKHALNKCLLMEKPFVPSPGEFISWCSPKPSDVGLPDLQSAYDISIKMNSQFSQYAPDCKKAHTVIKHVVDQIGSFNYRSMKAQEAFKTFESYYQIACQQFIDGKLKEITKAIPEKPQDHPSDKIRSNEARIKAMEEIRSMGIAVSFKQ